MCALCICANPYYSAREEHEFSIFISDCDIPRGRGGTLGNCGGGGGGQSYGRKNIQDKNNMRMMMNHMDVKGDGG